MYLLSVPLLGVLFLSEDCEMTRHEWLVQKPSAMVGVKTERNGCKKPVQLVQKTSAIGAKTQCNCLYKKTVQWLVQKTSAAGAKTQCNFWYKKTVQWLV